MSSLSSLTSLDKSRMYTMIGVSCICIYRRLISAAQRYRDTETPGYNTILANGLCVEPYVELHAELDAAIFKIATTSTRDVGFYV